MIQSNVHDDVVLTSMLLIAPSTRYRTIARKEKGDATCVAGVELINPTANHLFGLTWRVQT